MEPINTKKPRLTNDLWAAIDALRESVGKLGEQVAGIDRDLLMIARELDQAKHNLTLLNQHNHRDSLSGFTSPPYLFPPNAAGSDASDEER